MGVTRRSFLRNLCITGGSAFVGACDSGASARARAGDDSFTPAYVKLEDEGLLQERIEAAYDFTSSARYVPASAGWIGVGPRPVSVGHRTR